MGFKDLLRRIERFFFNTPLSDEEAAKFDAESRTADNPFPLHIHTSRGKQTDNRRKASAPRRRKGR